MAGEAPWRGSSDSFVQLLHAQASGVPLFVNGMVDELIASGALKRLDGGWEFPTAHALSVPRSIADVVEAQLSRLTAEQQVVLGAASVSGVEFQDLPLADVLQLGPLATQAALAEAAARLPGPRSVGASRCRASVSRRGMPSRTRCIDRSCTTGSLRHSACSGTGPGRGAHGPARRASSEIAAELALHFERGEAPAAAAEQSASSRHARWPQRPAGGAACGPARLAAGRGPHRPRPGA